MSEMYKGNRFDIPIEIFEELVKALKITKERKDGSSASSSRVEQYTEDIIASAPGIKKVAPNVYKLAERISRSSDSEGLMRIVEIIINADDPEKMNALITAKAKSLLEEQKEKQRKGPCSAATETRPETK